MSASNISLPDAQATPATHTFVPVGRDSNGVFWWEDTSSASAVGNARISAQLVRAPVPAAGTSAGGRVNRVKLGIHVPALETLGTNDRGITPPPQVAYITRAQLEYILPDRSGLQDRKDIQVFLLNLLQNGQVTSMVQSFVGIF